MTDGESFGAWVKRRRRELDLTQERLAGLVGCATVTIKKLEYGQYRPSRQILEILARELAIPAAEASEFLRRGRAAPLVAEPANPYKGLLPFEEEDSATFFGREAIVEHLLARVAETGVARRLTVITGPSGCGKSSLVRAGLIPELRRSVPPGSSGWAIAYVTFGPDPLQDLALALHGLTTHSAADLRALIEQSEHGLRDLVRSSFPAAGDVVPLLVVDPLETLFTSLVTEPVRTHVIALLANALADGQGRLRAICTLRADHYDRPLRYPDLARLVQASTEVVVPMSPDEVARAVRGPAVAVGVSVEPELLATVAAEMRDRAGALPLLQYALREAFGRRSGNLLRLEDFRAIGGISGALEQRAEQIFHALDRRGQELARQVFLRLIAVGEDSPDTRRRVLLSELAFPSAGPEDSAVEVARSDRLLAVVEQFAHHRILTLDLDFASGVQTVELAHEALLESWQRLREWAETNRERLRVQRRLAVAAAEWEAAAYGEDFLPGGALLAQYEAFTTTDTLTLTARERAFLGAAVRRRDAEAAEEEARRSRELALAQASARAEQRAANRLRWLVAGLMLFLAATVALSTFALRQQQVAEASFRRAEAQRLAAEAITLYQRGSQHELVALLSIASLRLQRTVQGEQALDLALTLDYPQHLLEGHEDLVSAVAYAADGALAFSGDRAGRVRVWDTATGDLVRTLGLRRSPITAMALLEDQQQIVTGAEDGVLQIIDLTGKVRQTWPGHIGNVRSLAVLDDGRLLSAGDDGAVRLWDQSGAPSLHEYDPGLGPLVAALPLPRSDEVLIVARSGDLRSWDRSSGQAAALASAPGAVTAVALNPHGPGLALGLADGRLVLMDATDGPRHEMTLSEQALLALAFAPDGSRLAAGGADSIVRVVELADGTILQRLAASTVAVEALSFAPDGQSLISASGSSARIWRLAAPNPFRPWQGHAGPVTSAVILPAERLAITGGVDGYVKWWDIGSGRLVRAQQTHAGMVRRLVVSPDGQTVISGGADGLVKLWDVRDGWIERELELAEPVVDIAIAPAGDRVAAVGERGTAVLWDRARGVEIRRWPISYDRPFAVAFSADGALLLTAIYGVQRDTQRDMLVQTSDGTTVNGWALEDGAQDFTIALRDRRFLVFQANAGLKQLGVNRAVANQASFGPDQRLLVAAFDNSVQLWDIQSGAVAQTFVGHSNLVSALSVSGDGAIAATGSADGTARIWDLQSRAEIRRMTVLSGAITAVAISPQRDLILTGSDTGVIRLWERDLERVTRTLCKHLQRDLHADERATYAVADAQAICPARRGAA